jgi:hypothetical protein
MMPSKDRREARLVRAAFSDASMRFYTGVYHLWRTDVCTGILVRIASDGACFLDMLSELGIISADDPIQPWDFCKQLLDRTKRMRIDPAGKDVEPPAGGATWVWPAAVDAVPEKGVPPVIADLLTLEELRRILVRIAYERRKRVAGGLGLRVKALLSETVTRHWCHTLDQQALGALQ